MLLRYYFRSALQNSYKIGRKFYGKTTRSQALICNKKKSAFPPSLISKTLKNRVGIHRTFLLYTQPSNQMKMNKQDLMDMHAIQALTDADMQKVNQAILAQISSDVLMVNQLGFILYKVVETYSTTYCGFSGTCIRL